MFVGVWRLLPDLWSFAGWRWGVGCASVGGEYDRESRALQLGTQTLTSPGAVRAKSTVIKDIVEDGCRCWEAAPRSLELF